MEEMEVLEVISNTSNLTPVYYGLLLLLLFG